MIVSKEGNFVVNEAPSILRDAENIGTVGDFMTLVKDAEKNGRFYCQGCKKNLSNLIRSLPNDGESYVRNCPRCGRKLVFNAGWLTAKVIQAQQLKKEGLAPAVGTFKDVQAPGTMKEEPLPDGRKNIIVVPHPATSWSVAKGLR